MSKKAYYKKNREVILNKAKNYYENNKEKLREQAKNIETYLKKKKIEKENTEKIDITRCLKKKKQD